MHIAIIGHGNVGGALATRWVDAGHRVTLGVRAEPNEKAGALVDATGGAIAVASIPAAVEAAEVIALAVPWQAAREAVEAAGDFGGKPLIDCTNPWVYGEGLQVGFTTSGAEEIAGWAPSARVVKTLNQAGFETMVDPVFGDRRAVMFVAADDDDARETAMGLTDDLGFETIAAGPLRTARLLEPHAALWIDLALGGGQGRDFAWGILRR